MSRKAVDIEALAERVRNGYRFPFEEMRDLRDRLGLHGLGRLASERRATMHGQRISYVSNLHLNPSNVCVNHCAFCAYRKDIGRPGAWDYDHERLWLQAERYAAMNLREIHVVGALNPRRDLAWCEELLRGLRARFPSVYLKAYTAVEIAFYAERENLPVEAVLGRLQDAGMNGLTGGGAEVLSDRVRQRLCPDKIDGERYLEIHKCAHKMGIRSTSTLLFGHIETPDERLEHLYRIRDAQEESGGFDAFVPLVFHPEHTQLAHLPKTTARTVLETMAVSRLVLDNVAHIKAYWVSLGLKLAQIALTWGADDIDGTIAREKIHHSAGAKSPQGMTLSDLRRLIGETGLEPCERDGAYEPVETLSPTQRPQRPVSIPEGERMTTKRAVVLLESGHLPDLGRAANAVRHRLHPEPQVTFAVDRNINTTNACLAQCAFCAFARHPKDLQSWVIEREALAKKVNALCLVSERYESSEGWPSPQVLMQGGIHPNLDIWWYEDLFRWMRETWPNLHIHALSPPEIHQMASNARLDWSQTIGRLRAAGLDSIPGGGAEILSDAVRERICPGKCSADEWIGVMRAAHLQGVRTSATMVIGLGETMEQRAEHFQRLRDLQDETGGFTAFILWTFQPGNTDLGRQGHQGALGAWDYLRTLAVARLYLDNIANIQASWVTQGEDVAQLALACGANDMGSTMLEENVVAAAGVHFRMEPETMSRLCEDLGYRLVRRDFFYNKTRPNGKR